MNQILNLTKKKLLTKEKLLSLLEQGEDINLRNENGDTPLMLACRARNKDLAEPLLENLANPDNIAQNDDEDFERDTPLTIAADLGDIELVELILGFGANMNLTNKEGQTALMIAYRSHNVPMVLALIKHQSWVTKQTAKLIQKYPNHYDDQFKELFLQRESQLDLEQPQEICSIIKAKIYEDVDLKNQLGNNPILDSLEIIDSTSDLSGGNADDKIEVSILEIGNKKKVRLEYLYMFNWSYGEAHLILNSYVNGKKTSLLQFLEDFEKTNLNTFRPFCDLAVQLKLQNLPIQSFSKLMIHLLSRMVQRGFFSWKEHGISIRLNPFENFELDEQFAALIPQTPIYELNFD